MKILQLKECSSDSHTMKSASAKWRPYWIPCYILVSKHKNCFLFILFSKTIFLCKPFKNNTQLLTNTVPLSLNIKNIEYTKNK